MPKHKLGLGILVSGEGSNLQAILEAIAKGELKAAVKIVISDRPDALALERAKDFGVPCICLPPSNYPDRKTHEQNLVKKLEEFQVDLLVLAGYRRLLTSTLIEPFRNRIMNIHPSLLPSFKGLNAQRQAIEYGVKNSGCTVHFVEEDVDEGPIIAQAAVPVLSDDSVEGLTKRILQKEHQIYPLAIQWFSEDRIRVEGRKVIVERMPQEM